MPLNTQIRKGGELYAPPHGWGFWHLRCMEEAAIADFHSLPPDEVAAMHYDLRYSELLHETPFWKKGEQVLTHEYIYEDTSDGEVLPLCVGDKLRMWYSR